MYLLYCYYYFNYGYILFYYYYLHSQQFSDIHYFKASDNLYVDFFIINVITFIPIAKFVLIIIIKDLNYLSAINFNWYLVYYFTSAMLIL